MMSCTALTSNPGRIPTPKPTPVTVLRGAGEMPPGASTPGSSGSAPNSKPASVLLPSENGEEAGSISGPEAIKVVRTKKKSGKKRKVELEGPTL